jgi:hypothetical protein
VLSQRPAARSLALGLVAGTILVTAADRARAEPGDLVVAEALFRDGKELLAKKDYARACVKLGESFRRDPATGTLLALAMCHEREGKIASAWGEYVDVAVRSKVESRPDREKAARVKASELEPAVSRLKVILSEEAAGIPGLVIKYNGVVIGAAILGTALPVDGGMQSVEVSAPGKKPWAAKIEMAGTGDRRTIRVPNLDDAGAAPPPVKRSASAKPAKKPVEPVSDAAEAPEVDVEPTPSQPPSADTGRGLTGLQRAGIVTGIAGIAGLGVGGYFTLRAIGKNNDSKSGCIEDLCNPTGKQDRLDARNAGNFATVALIGGGALTAAGAAMLLFGGRSGSSSSKPAAAWLEAYPLIGTEGVGAAVRGGF